MAQQDAQGNFTPNPGVVPANTLSSGQGVLRNGPGAPDNSLGDNGDTYVNLATGDISVKYSGTFHAL